MSTVRRRHDIAERLLAASIEHDTEAGFLSAVVPEVRDALGGTAIAVLRANPPRWDRLAGSGTESQRANQELAAEAIDRDGLVVAHPWLAAPIGESTAVLVRDAEVESQEDVRDAAAALAATMEIVRQRQHLNRRTRRLEKILEVTHAWAQKDCTEVLLRAMAEAATELLGADRASIFLWDKANKQLVGRPALGMDDDELRIADDAGIVGQVLRTMQPRRAGGGSGESEIDRHVDRSTGYNTETLLCVPLVTPSGKCLGAFEVLNKHVGRFSDEDEKGLVELAAHAAVALESTQQFEELLSKHQQLVEQAAEGIQLVGHSPAIEAVQSTIRRIADTDLAILILGENGTGKEVVARSIHYLSGRRDQPFIAVNCAALTETLLESELFGHEKGAFTDARESRVGKFELASGGTLFLDEIGDMSLGGQAKLLRVLEDKTVVRVGGSKPIHTEVRILAATNQDLAAMVREKRFREDLFFRLNVVSLELPPLRERGDDVLLLAEHFLHGFCSSMGRPTPEFSAAAKKRLLAHAWRGNVRELRNLTERLAYLTTGDTVEVEDLAFMAPMSDQRSMSLDLGESLAEATKQFQAQYIRQTVEAERGNMSGAARRLGLHRSNLYRKMRQLHMSTDEDE